VSVDSTSESWCLGRKTSEVVVSADFGAYVGLVMEVRLWTCSVITLDL
jgi:hypothetical protein